MANELGFVIDVGLSNSAKSEVENTKRVFTEIEDNAKKAGVALDNAFNIDVSKTISEYKRIGSVIEEEEKKIAELEKSYARLRREMRSTSGSDPQRFLKSAREAEELNRRLLEQRDGLSQLRDVYEGYAEQLAAAGVDTNNLGDTTERLRTRILNLRDQIAGLILAEGDHSAEIRQLEGELQVLLVAQDKVTRSTEALRDASGGQFQGAVQGVQGLIGAYSAAAGAVSLFTGDQQKQDLIQRQLAQTLSILIGLQQVSTTLTNTSAFRTRTVTKLNDLWNASLQRLTVTTRAGTIALRTFVGVVTGGLALGIPILINLFQRWRDSQREAREEQERLNEALRQQLDQYSSGVGNSIGSILTDYTRLQREFVSLNGNLDEQEKFLRNNQEAFNAFGRSIQTIPEATQFLVNDEQRFRDTITARAEAMASLSVTTEEFSRSIKANITNSGLASQIQAIEEEIATLPQTELVAVNGTMIEFTNRAVRELQNQARTLKDEYQANTVIITQAQERASMAIDQSIEKNSIAQKLSQSLAGSVYNPQERAAYEKALNDSLRAFQDYQNRISELSRRSETERNQIIRDGLTEQEDIRQHDLDIKLRQIEEERQAYIRLVNSYNDLRRAGGQDLIGLNGSGLVDTSIFDEFVENATRASEESRQREEEATLNKLLNDYATYEQQRLRIAEDYQKRRLALQDAEGNLLAGVTQGNLDELNLAEQSALEQIDQNFAQRESTFRTWANAIANMSLEQLEQLLIETEAKLQDAEAFGVSDAETRAQVQNLRKLISEQREQANEGPSNRSIKEWKDLYKVLQNVERQFGELGDTIGGSIGDVISFAGEITSGTLSMINSITQLGEFSAQATERAAEGVSASILAVEKASIILTIVAAAAQIASTIVNLFRGDNQIEEFNNEARELNETLQQVKLNAQIDGSGNSIFGDDLWTRAKDNIRVAKDALEDYNNTLDSIANRRKYTGLTGYLADVNGIKNSFDSAAQSIANFSVQTRKGSFFKSSRYTSLAEAVPELFNSDGSVNMEAASSFLGSDVFNRLSTENQQYLQQMVDDWETYQDAVEAVNSYLSGIFGDLGSQMSDALVDAFRNGTDASEAFYGSVSSMLEQLAQDMIYSVTLGPLFEKAQEEFSKILNNENLTDDERFREYARILGELTENALGQQDIYNQLLEQAQREAEKNGFDLFRPDQSDDAGRQAVAQGFATASQDSINELNGRATAIQEIAYQTMTSVNQIAQASQVETNNFNAMLLQLSAINTNTQRLEYIQNDLRVVRGEMEVIQNQGLKMK